MEVCVKNRISRRLIWVATGATAILSIGALTLPVALRAQGARHAAVGMRFVRIGDAPAAEDMPAADADQVVVDNFSFMPATASVPVGTTVTWTNHDDIPHNVVSPEQKFKSPVLDTDEVYSHTFEAAGTYKYYCSIHPRMTGQVVVR